MERVTYKKLKGWINDWNAFHPEMLMDLRAYNGYYHIERRETGYRICCEKNPGRCWKVFSVWKDGYWTGRDTLATKLVEGVDI